MTAHPPPPVLPGDRVGVAALSGPVDPDRLEAGLTTLRRLGFSPVVADNVTRRTPLFAGEDGERLDAFHRLASDPKIGAIFFARGGHGILRLLDRIDWELLARFPRAYIGYSDLTPFLDQVVARLGVWAFHGPMVAVEMAEGLTSDEERSLLGSLAGDFPRSFSVAPCATGRFDTVEGPLRGGCLSLLTATLGTEFAPSLAHSILFWEDVEEPLYRLDRMLTHLELSGSLTAIRGMVLGHVKAMDPEPGEEGDDASQTQIGSLDGLLADWASRAPWPVASGLAGGHDRPNLTLPLGARARLDPARGLLEVGLSAENDDGDDKQ